VLCELLLDYYAESVVNHEVAATARRGRH